MQKESRKNLRMICGGIMNATSAEGLEVLKNIEWKMRGRLCGRCEALEDSRGTLDSLESLCCLESWKFWKTICGRITPGKVRRGEP